MTYYICIYKTQIDKLRFKNILKTCLNLIEIASLTPRKADYFSLNMQAKPSKMLSKFYINQS